MVLKKWSSLEPHLRGKNLSNGNKKVIRDIYKSFLFEWYIAYHSTPNSLAGKGSQTFGTRFYKKGFSLSMFDGSSIFLTLGINSSNILP